MHSPDVACPSRVDRLVERSATLDIARILAASMLFWFHAGLHQKWPLSGLGANGTFVFIVLAGFCAVRFSMNRAEPPGFLAFPLSRLKRLYPMYWIASAAIFLGSYIQPADAMTHPFEWQDLLMNIFGVNQYFGERYLSRTMWFIPFVVQIYFLVPVFLRLPFAPVVTTIWCYMISVVACVAVFAIAGDAAPEICRAWSPIFRLPTVYLGIALALCVTNSQRLQAAGTFAVCAVILRLATWRFPEMATTFNRPFDGMVVALGVFSLAWLFARLVQSRDLPHRVVTILGQASYPFFLIHGVMIAWISRTLGHSRLVWIGYFILCWSMAVLVCKLSLGLARFPLRSLFKARRSDRDAPTLSPEKPVGESRPA